MVNEHAAGGTGEAVSAVASVSTRGLSGLARNNTNLAHSSKTGLEGGHLTTAARFGWRYWGCL
jgi:hypothetical protein